MPQDYQLFDIQFFGQPNAGRYSVAVTCPLVPGEPVGEFISPSNNADYQARFAQLQALDTDEDMLIALGRQLFDALFQGQIRDAYTNARAALKPGQGMRLRFSIDPRQLPEVAGLPWEFLCDAEERPLVLYDTPIVRYLPRFAAPPTIATPRPLRILLTAAAPGPDSEEARQLERVRTTLADLVQNGSVVLEIEPHLTIEALDRRLHEGFHLWHFVGHGKLTSDASSGVLVLEDGEGSEIDFSARDLRVMLNAARDQQRQPDAAQLQLILLDACNSAQLTTRPYRSIAPALMLENIGAVIAMQFKTAKEATQPFARSFYQALIAGEALDTCVMRGRLAVSRVTRLRNPDWGIPTVYTRAPDARLFVPPADNQASTDSATRPATSPPSSAQSDVQGSAPSSSTVGVSSATPGHEQAEDTGYEQRVAELNGVLAGLRSKRALLQVKNAKGQLTIGEQLDLQDTEKDFDMQRRALLELRQEWLATLERRAAQPGRKNDATLGGQLADMRAIVLEETLAVRQRDLELLRASYRIQPSDRARAQVQEKINAVQAEIETLKHQRNP